MPLLFIIMIIGIKLDQNADLMLVHRLRRCPNNKPPLGGCVVFTERVPGRRV